MKPILDRNERSARNWALALVATCLLAAIFPAASALATCPDEPCFVEMVRHALAETTSGGRFMVVQGAPSIVNAAPQGGHLVINRGPAPWSTLVIDPIRITRPTLAADSLGLGLASYFDVTRRDLKFARQAGGVRSRPCGGDMESRGRHSSGGWSRESVDTVGSVGQHSSVARILGGVGIAYYDSTHGDLKYAQKIGKGAWTVQRVDSGGNVGLYPSLAVNLSNGARAISYYDASRGVLRLAIGTAGRWSLSTVDSSGNVGGYTSMIMRPNGYGIAYYDYTREDLRYVSYEGSAYHFETVDSVGSVGRFCSLTGWGNSPRAEVGISYYDAGAGDLRYAQRMGAWVHEIQDYAGNTGLFTSCINTASGDSLGIVYYNLSDHRIRYLRRPTLGGARRSKR